MDTFILYHLIVERGIGEDDLQFQNLPVLLDILIPLVHLCGGVFIVRRIAEGDTYHQASVLAVGCQSVEERLQVHAFLIGDDTLASHVQLTLGSVVAEPVVERLSVGVVAVDEGHVHVNHLGNACHHDFTLRDIALGQEPGIRVAGVGTLQLGTGTGRHDNRQAVASGIAQDVLRMRRMVGTDNGMARVVASLGVSQFVGQVIEVLGILVMVAQVQLDLTALLLLCLVDVLQCPIDAGLPL